MGSVPRFCSVQNKMEDIRQDPHGKQIFVEMMSAARVTWGSIKNEVRYTEAMERTLSYCMSVVSLISQAGGAVTEEMVLEFNTKLLTIPKLQS